MSLLCLKGTTSGARIRLLVHIDTDVIVVGDMLLLLMVTPMFFCSFRRPIMNHKSVSNLILFTLDYIDWVTYLKDRLHPSDRQW